MKKTFLFLLFALAFCAPVKIFSQTEADTAQYRIVMNDDNEFFGRIIYQDSAVVKLKTEKLGELTLKRKDISQITQVRAEQIRGGELWLENPQSTRYLFAPNGYGLKQGEGYYQNSWIFFNQASYGLTDYFSIGAGVVPTFLWGAPFSFTPIWFTPKFSIPIVKNKFNVGVGVFAATIPGETSEFAGIAYGVGTYGSRDNNFTLGAGYGFVGSDFATKPLFTASGMIRVSRKFYLITENYFFFDVKTAGMVSLAGRWIYQTASLDFGLIRPLDAGDFIALPWLGFTIPFGK